MCLNWFEQEQEIWARGLSSESLQKSWEANEKLKVQQPGAGGKRYPNQLEVSFGRAACEGWASGRAMGSGGRAPEATPTAWKPEAVLFWCLFFVFL